MSKTLKVNNTHFFYISNLFIKAPGLNLGKKLNNLLSNRDALNYYPTFCIFFPFPNKACIAV